MQIDPTKAIEGGILKTSFYSKIQQVGVDLTLASDVTIQNGASVNVSLNESVYLPSHMYAMLYGRSSYNRRGILIRGSVYDPGYQGVIGCTIYNLSGETILMNANTRICQMLFFEANPASSYSGQFQGEGLKSD